jgi:hypothetical protein
MIFDPVRSFAGKSGYFSPHTAIFGPFRHSIALWKILDEQASCVDIYDVSNMSRNTDRSSGKAT